MSWRGAGDLRLGTSSWNYRGRFLHLRLLLSADATSARGGVDVQLVTSLLAAL